MFTRNKSLTYISKNWNYYKRIMKFIFLTLLLSLLVAVLLIQVVNASNVVSCFVNPQEVNLSASNQVTVMIQLNNSKNETVEDNAKISYTSYFSCVGACEKKVTTPAYSISNVNFTLQALSTTNEKQAITITDPSPYACPDILKIISGVIDTTPPTIGSVSPTSVTASQSATFTASVSDNVGVTGCNFFLAGQSYTASVSGNTVSYSTALTEGGYSAYFKCWDAAGNTATGPTVTVTASKPQPTASMFVSISLPKTTYYPVESFEPRVTIKDASGNLVVDATIKSNITGPKTYYPYFYYSSLCDCYKGSQWLDEGALSGDYTLLVTASHSNFKTATASATFKVIKPVIQTFTITTDKTEYLPGDSVTMTVTMKDSLGNFIKDAYITGEIRDETGNLVNTIHPRIFGDVYTYTYYLGFDSLGKTYKISVSTTWKEQKASADTTVSVPKKGLNAEIILGKDVLMPGDILEGKVKVFDKSGNIISDAKVSMEIKLLEAKSTEYKAVTGSIRWLSATYKDGFYEIEKWKVDEWISPGTYTLSVKVDRVGESITVEKTIEITKQKLNVSAVLDQTSYAPGDRFYLKVYVTYPNGSIVPNANIGGEIFPLIQETVDQTSGITGSIVLVTPGSTLAAVEATPTVGPPRMCRIYVYPMAPIYYKGDYYPKYYIDDNYIPTNCPIGQYALRLQINAPGYMNTEYTKEFDVTLHKLLLEAGFKTNSRPDTVELSIYAEVKDEEGKAVPYASVKGYLHPVENVTGTCTKAIYFGYDEFVKRYTSKTSLVKSECTAGKYSLELTASQSSYETASAEQSVEINYTEGYEYNVVVPPAIAAPVTCKEVSCGDNCINRVCETPVSSQECYEEVTDKTCLAECSSKATSTEEAASKGIVAEFDVKSCINSCTKKVACKGSNVASPGTQDMLNKLEEISTELKQTNEQVSVVVQLLRSILNFLNSIVSFFGGNRMASWTTPVLVNTSNMTNITGP